MKFTKVQLDVHYTPAFYAELWQVSKSTVLRWFQDQPGVLKIGKQSKNGKRVRVEIRIPLSLAMTFYEERTK